MILPTLVIPSVKSGTVAARLRLGRGLRMAFTVQDQQGELLLEPGRAPRSAAPLYFDSACGLLAFSEPGPMSAGEPAGCASDPRGAPEPQ